MKIIEHGKKPTCEQCNCEFEVSAEFTCEHCGCKFEVEIADCFLLKDSDETEIHAVCPECGAIAAKKLMALPQDFKVNEKVIFTPDSTTGVVIGRNVDDSNVYLVKFIEHDDPKCGKVLQLNRKLLEPITESVDDPRLDNDISTNFNPYDELPNDYNLKDLLSAVADEASEVGEMVCEKLKNSVSPEKIEQFRVKATESAQKGKEKIQKIMNSRPTFHEGDYVKKKVSSPDQRALRGVVYKSYNTGIYSVWFEGKVAPSLITAELIELDEEEPKTNTFDFPVPALIIVGDERIPSLIVDVAEEDASPLTFEESKEFKVKFLLTCTDLHMASFPIPVLILVDNYKSPGVLVKQTGQNEYTVRSSLLAKSLGDFKV